MTSIRPHAAAAAAEAVRCRAGSGTCASYCPPAEGARNGDLLGYAAQLSLDVAVFDRDRASIAVADRIRQDVDSGLASGQVLGTPTLFIDGVVHRGGYDPPTLLTALAP